MHGEKAAYRPGHDDERDHQVQTSDASIRGAIVGMILVFGAILLGIVIINLLLPQTGECGCLS